MTEIKFRAWDKQWKSIVRVTMILFNTNEIDFESNAGEPKSLEHFELMQFTGLKDKNGKEIYEGDIINGLVVTYLGDSNAGLGMNAGWYLQRDDFESWVELECRCNENENNYEIIGNIYENPELLNG